jgi:ribosomal-protein-serine acetyltransferase
MPALIYFMMQTMVSGSVICSFSGWTQNRLGRLGLNNFMSALNLNYLFISSLVRSLVRSLKGGAMIFANGLLLRPFQTADAAVFTAAVLESFDTAGPWMPWCSPHYSEQDALTWFALSQSGLESGNACDLGIFCQETGEFLGGAGLNSIAPINKLCNLGYWVRQSRHRQGIALRCVRALSEHAFSQLGMQRVEIVVAVGNRASEAVAVKAGAQREGVARKRLYLHGAAHDAHMFALVSQ